MAFWGVQVEPGCPFTLKSDARFRRSLHISQATLAVGTSTKTSLVQCSVGNKSPVLLCALLPDKAESSQLNLEFDETEDVIFSVIGGPRGVYLTGFFTGESFEDIANSESEESDEQSDEDGYESSFINDDDDDDIAVGPTVEEDSDKPKKKRRKRQQEGMPAENNLVVPERKANENISEKAAKKKKKKSKVQKNDEKMDVTVSLSGEKENSINEDDDDIAIGPTVEEGSDKPKKKRRKRQHEGMPAENNLVDENTFEKAAKKKEKKSKVQKNDGKMDVTVSLNGEKENSINEVQEENFISGSSQVRTLSNGLVIEDLESSKSDGKAAALGRKLKVQYTAKLKGNGEIIDTNGKAPYRFRLGDEDVMEGWNIGLEGMRAGDKRRLVVPPSLGNGSRGTAENVPPDSWVIYDVELLSVH